MVGALMRGEVDMIITSLTLKLERARAVHYLPPMAKEQSALFISSNNAEEGVSWWTYVEPFSMVLWLMVLLVALVNATFITVVNYIYGKRKKVVSFTTANNIKNTYIHT